MDSLNFSENFDRAIKEKGLTSKDVAEKISALGERSISKESIAKYRRGERTPDPVLISLASEVLDIPEQDFFDKRKKLDWIKEYLSNPNDDSKKALESVVDMMDTKEYINIPVLDIVAGCGSGGIVESDVEVLEYRNIDKALLPVGVHSDKLNIIPILGRSMEPVLYEGDYVVVEMKNGDEIEFVSDYYLISYGGLLQVKYIQVVTMTLINIISKNPDEPNIMHDFNENQVQCEILGKVVAMIHLCGALKRLS
jgi:phage repressor protein C with HTH and peptisase S24 domain